MTELDPDMLQSIRPPEPSPDAREKAQQAAIAAFRAAQKDSSQGISDDRRHPCEPAESAALSAREKIVTKSSWTGRAALGLGTCSVLALGFYAAQFTPLFQSPLPRVTGIEAPDPASIPSTGAEIAKPAESLAPLPQGEVADAGASGDIVPAAPSPAEPPAERLRAEREWRVAEVARIERERLVAELEVAKRVAELESARGDAMRKAPQTTLDERQRLEPEIAQRRMAEMAKATRQVTERESARSEKERAASSALAAMPTLEARQRLAAKSVAAPEPPRPAWTGQGRDKFESFAESSLKQVAEAPVSTFSIDADTASYAFVRRQLNQGLLPPKDAVRVEEMINYFDYDYALPEDRKVPFRPSVTLMPTPWNGETMLMHIGIKGYDVTPAQRPRANLVFLIDVSGSMNEPDKLPLARSALKLLVETLQPDDRVAIVTYAGHAGVALEPTQVKDKAEILAAIDRLDAGGGTAGAAGIRQAYSLARAHFVTGGVNRVLLATDGDFNIGISDPQQLQDYIERERKSGVFLSVLGFGEGNYNDALMQKLAQNGNGVAAYIDSLQEARHVLVDAATSMLFPIAKDVKIQVEFNPAKVSAYRLIGYETRNLQREDFNNDAVDAGEIGAGHAVTAIYEITPAGGPKQVDDLRYQKEAPAPKAGAGEDEYAMLKIRYKLPDANESRLIGFPVTSREAVATVAEASDDVRFAAAVAAFGQVLRGGKYTGTFGYRDIATLANGARGKDERGQRIEFVNLVRLAETLPAMPAQGAVGGEGRVPF
jgi:Ca-activated chloride channel family protein